MALSIQERLGVASEAIESAAWQWACMLRSSIPAKVVSFDSVAQTCVVQIQIQEMIYLPPVVTNPASPNPAPGNTRNVPTPTTIPNLEDVPIVMMRVPGWSITMPITPGTECLLIFSDMCIDGWWETGKLAGQRDHRRHDLSDAIALFGPWSQPHKLTNYSTSSMQIRSDDQSVMIDLAPGAVTITAPVVNVAAVTGLNLTAPAITLKHMGGVPKAILNANFYDWFTTVYMPSVMYVTTAPALPISPESTILKAE